MTKTEFQQKYWLTDRDDEMLIIGESLTDIINGEFETYDDWTDFTASFINKNDVSGGIIAMYINRDKLEGYLTRYISSTKYILQLKEYSENEILSDGEEE